MSSTKFSDRDPVSHGDAAASCNAHLGIDVSKAKLDVPLLRLGKLKHKVVANTPAGFEALLNWLRVQDVDLVKLHVCMEAIGPYSEACATALADATCVVSVVNPARIKGFGQSELIRNKTDEVDAGLIARFCATMHPSSWLAPAPEQRQLRALVERMQALQDNLQQQRNRLAVTQEQVRASIQAHVAYLAKAIVALKADIDEHIYSHWQLKHSQELLTSIDAAGDVTACKVLACAGDVQRFDSAKAFSAFGGVAPRQKRLGSSVRGRSMMGKGGSNPLRHALFMPAMVAMRYNDVVKDLALRLKARGLKGKAIVGGAMHKLAHLIYGVLKTQTLYRADWAKNANPMEVSPQEPASA